MKRIFIEKLVTNFDPVSLRVDSYVKFSSDIINIATVNKEFHDFLVGFLAIWKERIEEKLEERVSSFLLPEGTNGYMYNMRLSHMEEMLTVFAEDVADYLEKAITNKFVETEFRTIDLVKAEVPVKYYRFKSDIDNDFVYMTADSLFSKSYMLGSFDYNPVRKRNVRI